MGPETVLSRLSDAVFGLKKGEGLHGVKTSVKKAKLSKEEKDALEKAELALAVEQEKQRLKAV